MKYKKIFCYSISAAIMICATSFAAITFAQEATETKPVATDKADKKSGRWAKEDSRRTCFEGRFFQADSGHYRKDKDPDLYTGWQKRDFCGNRQGIVSQL